MKDNFFAIVSLIAMGFCAEGAQGEGLPSEEAKLLVQSCPAEFSDPAYIDKWRLEVKSKQGITQDLLAMLKQEEDWEVLGMVFATLRERTDIPVEVFDDLKKPLYGIPSDKYPMDMRSTVYATGVIGVMRNFPTPENEKLLLSILDKREGPISYSIFATLADIGTVESLKKLQDYKSVKPNIGGLEIMDQAIISIEKRIGASERNSVRERKREEMPPVYQKGEKGVLPPQIHDIEQTLPGDKWPLSQWLILSGLMGGVLILLLKFIRKVGVSRPK